MTMNVEISAAALDTMLRNAWCAGSLFELKKASPEYRHECLDWKEAIAQDVEQILLYNLDPEFRIPES